MQECILQFADPTVIIIAAVVGLLLFVNMAQVWTERHHEKRKKLRKGR